MKPIDGSFWDSQALCTTPAAYQYWIGERAILFDSGTQQVFEQNCCSAAIWAAICSEGTATGAARSLAGNETEFQVILGHAREALGEWFRRGLVIPAALSGPATAPQQIILEWMGCCVALNVSAAMDIAPLTAVFQPFLSSTRPSRSFEIQEMGGLIFITDEHRRTCARSIQDWIPEVKARFTATILRSIDTGYLVHAALVSRNGRGLLVCGPPGAGKSTLSVSLSMSKFVYHADDVVWVGEAGFAVGAPFAPAMKEGSWPILEQMAVGIHTLPTYRRRDGQRVRYLSVPTGQFEPVKICSIILLDRQASGPARIEAIEPIEVLTSILSSAYSTRGALSPPALESLIGCIQGARRGRLSFSEWSDARQFIDKFVP